MKFCVGCMGTSDLLNIFDTYVGDDGEENYAEMLKMCFNIEILPEDNLGTICSSCIKKLKESYYFKKQITITRDILASTKDMKIKFEPEIKEEYLDEALWDSLETTDNIDYADDDFNDVIILKREKEISNDDCDENGRKYGVIVDEPLDETVIKKYPSKQKRKREYKPEKRPYTLEPNQTICDLCGEKFLHHRLLIIHMNTHFPNHICDVCGKKYATIPLLKRHLKSHLPGPFYCKYCNMKYMNRNTLMTHTRFKHSDAFPYICSECKERFRSFHQKLSHLKEVHGQTEKKYLCQYCPMKFYYAGQRSKHINHTHLKLKPYKCTECTMVFSKRIQLECHLAHAHKIGEKKYECHVCLKKYCQRRTLVEHLRIHANDRKFRCELCNVGFVQKCSLKSHILTHQKHGLTLKMEGNKAILIEN